MDPGKAAGDVMKALAENIDESMITFSEIDGTFPNHHPDPSEPKNLLYKKTFYLKEKRDSRLMEMVIILCY